MRKGFTLVETAFVIVILGILAAIVIPKLTAVQKTHVESDNEQVQNQPETQKPNPQI